MKKILLTASIAVLGLSACKKDDEKAPLSIPSTYESANYEANTVEEKAILKNLDDLKAAIKAASESNPLDEAALKALYEGSKLQSATSAYYNTQVLSYLKEVAAASTGGAYDMKTEGRAANGKGGFFGGRLFEEGGLELIELIEKGLFEAALYHHAYGITQKTELTPADIDRLVAIFGAHPSFPNSSDESKHQYPDKYAARYAAKRDKNDGKGFYTNIKNALLKAQAAVKAGKAYDAELRAALKEYLTNWEKSCAATIINYLYNAQNRLTATSPSDNDLANALHAHAEAVGFLHGWRRLPQNARIITDSQVDEILNILKAPAESEASAYLFVTDTFNQVGKLTEAINKIKEIYGFSNTDLEDFKKDWVVQQGR
ncbi:hypothetical protein FHS56_000649 [Thermonema lapsum]|uniref:DUF4856 domain-containing protein n=1 Tax=Thermonema lapsum TaxID=28195 RepID=A0A846MNN1_9BACT|nr:hypothetical protein [Thermonema lapsum]NIK73163.1 hypothetical protein [Thermonema lapsum]